jgi:hypothetical protein
MDDIERKRSFDLHREQQRRAWLALSPRERLTWLEQAKEFAARAVAAARKRAGKQPTR